MPVFQLPREILFPDPDFAEPNGLLAVGGDLSHERLLAAYRLGIFPWYAKGEPILWWSPAPRLILLPEEFHLPKRLARIIRKKTFSTTVDTAFSEIITECAESRIAAGEGTWITEEMKNAYTRLHELGYAHSIECWQDNVIVGGLYGVCLDGIFFGESMFSLVSNSSKVALASLVSLCRQKDIKVIDCQMTTTHLLKFGAREISRTAFQQYLNTLIGRTTDRNEKWRLEENGKEGIASTCPRQEEGK